METWNSDPVDGDVHVIKIPECNKRFCSLSSMAAYVSGKTRLPLRKYATAVLSIRYNDILANGICWIKVSVNYRLSVSQSWLLDHSPAVHCATHYFSSIGSSSEKADGSI